MVPDKTKALRGPLSVPIRSLHVCASVPQGLLAIGDTLYTGSKRISYSKIPSFSPEVFARCLCPSPSKAKNFNKGLEQLIAEGAVQLLRERGEESGGGVPILAAVGPLQVPTLI